MIFYIPSLVCIRSDTSIRLENALTSVTRVFISLLVAFSYPLQCLPARTSMMALWHRLDKDKIIDASVSRFRYIACTVSN